MIREVTNVSFSHLACDDQAAVVVHWSASPLGLFTFQPACLHDHLERLF